MNKKIFFAVLATAAIFASCEKNNQPYADRTPNKVDFVERSLEGITVGAELTDAVEAVDLGLSVKWANMNLGATSAEESGSVYQWGEIEPATSFTWASYEYAEVEGEINPTTKEGINITKYCFDKYGHNQDIESNAVSLHKNDDAAYVAWGEGWRMPTEKELVELKEKCTWTAITGNSYLVTSKINGNSITITVANASIEEASERKEGGILSSNLANFSAFCKILAFDGNQSILGMNRCNGYNIRPVHTK